MKNSELISKAKMKAAICCAPLSRRLLALKVRFPKTTADYVKAMAKLNDSPEMSFYENKLSETDLSDVPAMCKRLAYHLDVFAFANCRLRKTVCNDLRIIGLRGSETSYKKIVAFEPVNLIVYDSGEVAAEY